MGRTHYGVKNFHYSPLTETVSGSTTTYSYGEWVSVPGTVTFSTDPQANSSDFYADDVVWDTVDGVVKETGSVEFATLSDVDKVALLGYVTDSTSGLTYKTTAPISDWFAIGYESTGNTNKMRGIRYKVKFSLPSEQHNTMTENTNPDTITLNFTAIGVPLLADEDPILKAHVDGPAEGGTASSAYTKFFDHVLIPGTASV